MKKLSFLVLITLLLSGCHGGVGFSFGENTNVINRSYMV